MDQWQIPHEERVKHDMQFMQLNPVNGYITGDQAKHFFLQSTLPPAVLGQIWNLADYNNDGRMDRKEFSIAMFLIKRRLLGQTIPSQLPPGLLVDPIPPSSAGTPGSPLMRPHAVPNAGGAAVAGASTLPRMFPTNFPVSGPAPASLPTGGATLPMSGANMPVVSGMVVQPGVGSGFAQAPAQEEWSIPAQAKLRYRQQFNQQDRAKRGFLLGLEAKSVLMQSGLPNHVLAQIWNLSDVDKDGKLTCDEFCLAMHLAEMGRAGHPLPAQLPRSLIPPAYRSPGGAGSGTGRRLSSTSSTNNEEAEETKQAPPPITIEDKRRENFLKGQAELERRQAALRERMRQEEEARLAKERAEMERQERIRLEKERQRQAELERQQERQRALEAEREEYRRRAAEERERARREMERQRLIEAEKKRTEAAVQDKHRATAALEQAKAKEADLRQEMENLEARRRDGGEKLEQSRAAVAEYKSRIETMRTTRDGHLSEIEALQGDIESAKTHLNLLQREREELSLRVQTIFESNPTAEQHKALRTNYEAKKNAHEKLRRQIQELQDELNMKGQELAGTRNKVSVQERQFVQLQRQVKGLRGEVRDRWSEWQRRKATLPNGTAQAAAHPPPANSKDDSFSALWDTAGRGRDGPKTNAADPFPTASFDAVFDTAFGGAGGAVGASAGPGVSGAGAKAGPVSGFEVDPFASAADPFCDSVAPAAVPGGVPVDDPFASEDPFAGEANPFASTGADSDPFASAGGDPFAASALPGEKRRESGGGFDAVFGGGEAHTKSSTTSGAVNKGDSSDPFADLGVNFGNTPSPFAAAFQSAALGKQSATPANSADPFAASEGTASSGFDGAAFPSPSVDWASAFADSAQKMPAQEGSGMKTESTSSATMVTRRERCYRASYSFEARQSDELSFAEGDKLYVTVGEDDKGREWWTGRLEGQGTRRGIFPSSYVRPVADEDDEETEYNEIEPIATALSAVQEPPQEDYGMLGDATSTRPPAPIQPQPRPGPPDLVEALYPWEGKEASHLSFAKGARIRILERQHDDWWMGETGGRTGWFPKTYVRPLPDASAGEEAYDVLPDTSSGVASPPAAAPAEAAAAPSPAAPAVAAAPSATTADSASPRPQSPISRAVAIFPYKSTEAGDLTFEKGEHILILKKEDEWWTGRIGNRTGVFPGNFVTETPNLASPTGQGPEPPGSSGVSSLAQLHHQQQSQQRSETPTSVASTDAIYGVLGGKRPPVAKVIAPYTATGPEQISLVPGQLIQVRKKSPSGWWEGEVQQRGQQRRLGWFPANYVRVLDSGGDLSTAGSGGLSGARPSSSIAAPFPSKSAPQPALTPSGPVAPPAPATAPAPAPAPSPAAPGPGPSSAPAPAGHERVVALYAYRAMNADELSFPKGAVIVVLGRNEQEWWPGRLEETGAEGVFPVNYVQPLAQAPARAEAAEPGQAKPADGQGPPAASAAGADAENEVVVSLYAHAAQNSDELTFAAGKRIVVLARSEREWWHGRVEETGETGMFPVNYVRPVSAPAGNPSQGRPKSWYCEDKLKLEGDVSDRERHRQFYIQELIETEKSYLSDLNEIKDVFYEPMKQSGIVTAEEVDRIFINWMDLIRKSYGFYMSLKVRRDNVGARNPIQCIGDIILSNILQFDPYTRFCSCQNSATGFLQMKVNRDQKFKEFVLAAEQKTANKMMNFASYFLKPMQRITKYQLIIENILKYTDADHPDYGALEEALTAARSLCESVNEGVRTTENSERLEWLQSHCQCDGLPERLVFNSTTNCLGHRKLLHYGTLFKSKSGKELVAFLFNDFLLLTSPNHSTNGQPFVFPTECYDAAGKNKLSYKMYREPIFLNEVMISEGSTPSEPSASSIQGGASDTFSICEVKAVTTLRALSSTDRDRWVDKLRAAAKSYHATQITQRERSASLKRSACCGRLLVNVVEGINLMPGNVGGDGKSDPYCVVTLGNQEHKTKVIHSTLHPKWNSSMQFMIKNVEQDVLCITVYDKDYFSPNEFLGRTELRLKDICQAKSGIKGFIERREKLSEVNSGEIVLKLDVQIFEENN